MKDKKIRNHETDLNEERVLIEWEAPAREWQKRDKEFWINVISILALLSVIFIFIKEFFLVIALFSALFFYYVMSSVEPEKITNKITNWGVHFGEAKYGWEHLVRFWFKKKLSCTLLEFETGLKFPRQISLVINESDRDRIKEMVIKKVPLIESKPNFIDDVTEWFSKRLPLEAKKS
jgi:hypothetical protein